jgi:radical SAM superfamily enzyme YgiQ (UPF0313 family)|tara:strand:- start:2602 stop:4311 length:1710 start_codon:yes stop_codon:yes gene_type:complete
MSKCNVLFIVPPNLPLHNLLKHVEGDNPGANLGTTRSMPMGVLSIAGYVAKHADVNFEVLDLNLEVVELLGSGGTLNWDKFLNYHLKERYNKNFDIVGITAIFNSNVGYVLEFSKLAKKNWPNCFIVAGGGAPSNLSSYVFSKSKELDAIAVGEAEKPFLNLVKSKDRKAFVEEAKGWTTRKRMLKKIEVPMDLIDNLDDIPPLPYQLIDFNRYQAVNRFHGDTSSSVCASIMVSRGCPFKCNFCATHIVHGRTMRYNSADRVVSDVRRLKKDYGVNVLLIEDDLFFGHKVKAKLILQKLKHEDLKIEFTNGISVQNMMHEETVDALKEAGANMAQLAVESGSERVLTEIIHKPYQKLSRVRKAITILRERDFYIRGSFVLGFPGEKKEEILESVNFMKQAGFNWVSVMIATPIAGSPLYEYCKKHNLLVSDNPEDYHIGNANIKLDHSTPEEIVEMRWLINLEVNFVENYDLKNGRSDLALLSFKNVISRTSEQAFAHYFSSVCYNKLGLFNDEKKSLAQYFDIIENSSKWYSYAKYFSLPCKRATTIDNVNTKKRVNNNSASDFYNL